MKIIAITVLTVALVGCSKEATLTVRGGAGGSVEPYINCEAGMPNPDYQQPATTDKP